MKNIEKEIQALHAAMEPHINELRALGVFDMSYPGTTRLYFDDLTVYFDSKEIDELRFKAKKLDKILELLDCGT